MSINLSKGERISLSKEAPGMKKVVAGLGWDVNVSDTGSDFDLDVSVFMLGASGKIPQEKYFVFYNNLKSPDGSVESMGDSRTGKGEGDDETITIDLLKVDSIIEEIIFVVTIYEAEKRRQNFGQVRNSYIRIYDEENEEEVTKYELEEDFSRETAIEFGKLYKKNSEWRFQAVGEGYNSGLESFVQKYN
ncbi:stress protein [Trichodesmium erythraeum IMS101]|uniref:Stress protein n=1 Tax=Trichodesmium erythraeum (strain IMS101) TaxID=203124 RepID=Q10UV8_TRIEI|nr:TerD family protein [Trichodesmium erythraeum GBRTRLIN201]MCH2047318.1 TerD family protein [Trichodesmium sp. ALOHA_ZT_67]MDE5093117.1 TerD family protein [Trichodesmium sp. St11_bin5]MDT9339103.1 TerD family protein [Trichodesmium erythraeum 21-75]